MERLLHLAKNSAEFGPLERHELFMLLCVAMVYYDMRSDTDIGGNPDPESLAKYTNANRELLSIIREKGDLTP